ncbi:hypothetical protein Hamer_G016872, partial [Homarus americanus]
THEGAGWGVPCVAAGGPGQLGTEGVVEEDEGVGNDHTVHRHEHQIHDKRRVANTWRRETDGADFVKGEAAAGGELTEGGLQQVEGQTHHHQHQQVRHQEC